MHIRANAQTQMASVESWSKVMAAAQMATEVGEQPMRDANKFIALFFVLFMVRKAVIK